GLGRDYPEGEVRRGEGAVWLERWNPRRRHGCVVRERQMHAALCCRKGRLMPSVFTFKLFSGLETGICAWPTEAEPLIQPTSTAEGERHKHKRLTLPLRARIHSINTDRFHLTQFSTRRDTWRRVCFAL